MELGISIVEGKSVKTFLGVFYGEAQNNHSSVILSKRSLAWAGRDLRIRKHK